MFDSKWGAFCGSVHICMGCWRVELFAHGLACVEWVACVCAVYVYKKTFTEVIVQFNLSETKVNRSQRHPEPGFG